MSMNYVNLSTYITSYYINARLALSTQCHIKLKDVTMLKCSVISVKRYVGLFFSIGGIVPKSFAHATLCGQNNT